MSYPILLIDDNTSQEFIKPLRESAFTISKFDLQNCKTWIEARALLQNSKGYYRGLILDGKGQKTPDSKAEDDSFLEHVKESLQDMARNGEYIPFVVYTGFADELKKYFNTQDIFWKEKGDEELMFKKLEEKIKDSELEKYRYEFPTVFDAIGGNGLPEAYGIQLKNILKHAEEKILIKSWFTEFARFY